MESLMEFSDPIPTVVHKDIPLAEFLSVCVHLSEECGKIIREVWDSGNVKQQTKTEGPVTEADFRVQKTIEVCLGALYPTLVVKGEESKKDIDKYESFIKPEVLRKGAISQELLNARHSDRKAYIEEQLMKTYAADGLTTNEFSSFNTANAIVWVDPLDGTSDFVKGNLPAVSVMIGVAINGYSRIGLIHQVFSDEDQTKGRTSFGTMEHGLYRLFYDQKMGEEELAKRVPEYIPPFDHLEQPAADHKFVVAASLMHFSDEMQKIIDLLSPVELKRIGGAGNKVFNVAYGNVDSYLHPSVGLMYWDLCPTETLIKAMGGYATNFQEERLKYPLDGDRKIGGLILAKNPQLHKMAVQRLGDMMTQVKNKFK